MRATFSSAAHRRSLLLDLVQTGVIGPLNASNAAIISPWRRALGMAETVLISFAVSPEKCATVLRRAVNRARPELVRSFVHRGTVLRRPRIEDESMFRSPSPPCLRLGSCHTAHDASSSTPLRRLVVRDARLSPGQGRLSAYHLDQSADVRDLGACEHLNRDSAGDQAFAAHSIATPRPPIRPNAAPSASL